MSSRKRPSTGPTSKGKRIQIGTSLSTPSTVASSSNNSSAPLPLMDRFLNLFKQNPDTAENGVSNAMLKQIFKENDEYLQLAPIINQLTKQSRLTMSQQSGGTKELFYHLVSDELANKLQGLDTNAKLVYQAIEKVGNLGIWTKDLRIQTHLQQQALTKVLKTLENRQLIKPCKSVAAKSKKLYMLYNLTPSTALTGGVWYSDLEFDHEFIATLRNVLLQCTRKKGVAGVTLRELWQQVINAKISQVELTEANVQQLVNTLIYDYLIEEQENEQGAPIYVTTRRITVPCHFGWWDCLEPDFHFRKIVFEDGVELPAQELHYQTS